MIDHKSIAQAIGTTIWSNPVEVRGKWLEAANAVLDLFEPPGRTGVDLDDPIDRLASHIDPIAYMADIRSSGNGESWHELVLNV